MLHRARVRGLFVAIVCLGVLGWPGCAPGPGAPDGDAAVPLVEPVTDRLEPSVRAELATKLAEVRRLGDQGDADPASVGRAYLDLGRSYHAYELYDAAAAAYVNARRVLPENHALAYYLGQCYRSLYDLDRAREVLEGARELKPGDEPTLIALANVHRDAQRFDEAEQVLRSVLDRNADSAGAMLLMATLASDRGDAARAVEWYERLLRLQPEADRLHQPLAMAYRSLGQVERAEELLASRGTRSVQIDDPLMAALETVGSGATHHVDRGVAAFERGQFDAAIEAFGKALEIAPDDVGARLNLGSALVQAKRFDEAIEQYGLVLEREPDHAMAHFNLGVLHAAGGDDAESIRFYEEALRIDPDYRDPRFNLGNALRRAGRCAEAIEHYTVLTDLDPRFAAGRIARVLCLLELERFEEAVADVEASLAVLPGDRTLTEILSRLLSAGPLPGIRNGDRAVRLAEGLVAAVRDANSLETLAMAQAEAGRFEAAVRTQQQALALAPDYNRPRLEHNLARYRQNQPCRTPAIL